MIRVRYNTNYGVLPDQKRWRVLINGDQTYADHVYIKTKAWTTKDIVKGDNGEEVEKFHITCEPGIFGMSDCSETGEKSALCTESEIRKDNEKEDLICIKWSVSANKWKVCIKGEDRLYDDIVFNTNIWTSDISPELCCRPQHIGLSESENYKKLYLSDY